MNKAGTIENLLYDFYGYSNTTDALQWETRIWTRTVFNRPIYLAKHPGGTRRLETVTQIDDYNIDFDPDTPPDIFSKCRTWT